MRSFYRVTRYSCTKLTSSALQVALQNGVTVTSGLDLVRAARKRGLRAPVLFMGYYNPMLIYGEERLIKDAREAGVNGFIVVDLPPEEAVRLRDYCTKSGYVMKPCHCRIKHT